MNTRAPAQPNIIFILADYMSYGDFNAFNGGLSAMPALDALCRKARAFRSIMPRRWSATPLAPVC